MKRALTVLFALYLCVVGYAVFGPNPGEKLDQAGAGLRKVERGVRLATPGGSPDGRPGDDDRPPDRWIFGDLGAADVGNIVMFVPFGAVFPVVRPRRWWLAVPAGVALSGFIELFQLSFLSWRSPSLSDIGWNSLGAVIGFGLWWAGSWWWRRLRVSPVAPSTEAPDA